MSALADLEKERRQKGIKTVKPGVASDEMCTFLIINISSLQLITVNVIAYRSQPTHLEVIKFLQANYCRQATGIVKKTEALVTEAAICAILDKYQEVLPTKRRTLILKYLLSKVQLLCEIYGK